MRLRSCATLVLALGIAGAAAMAQESPAAAQACTIRATTFDGWPAQEMQNSWVQLIFVPELGGRLMQVTFNGHPYLFVNPQWKGKYIPPDQARGRWINYGGDKIWPLPEGGDGITNDEQHWNGGSTPLDDGAYVFSIVSQGKQCSVRLDGPPDPTVGLQYSRIITIGPDSPEISFHAITRNYTGHSVDWSVQSVTQYSLAAPDQPNGYNHDFWGITPVNPHSAYLLGYHARDGLANDPSYSVKDGLFRDEWKYVEGEVWIDSPAGWLVTVDGPTKFAMVEKTRHIDAEYPGKASIIFYKNGPSVRLDSQGMLHYTETKTPYYMEAEVNSPIAHLETGQVYTFDTHWFPCRMGANFRTTVEAGVIGNPLQAIRNGDNVQLSGQFGVFYPGHLEARLYNRGGTLLSQVNLQSASPRDLINLSKTVEGARIALVSVHLIDTHGVDRGALGEVLVTGGNGGAF